MDDESAELTREELVRVLREKFKYAAREAQVFSDDLKNLAEPVRTALFRYLRTGELPEMEVRGWTAKRLIDEKGYLAPGAIVMLSSMMRNPVATLAALSRGFDRVRAPERDLER